MNSTDFVLIGDHGHERTKSTPLTWHPRFLYASQKDRDDWQVAGGGFGIHWPTINEHHRVDGLVRSEQAPLER